MRTLHYFIPQEQTQTLLEPFNNYKHHWPTLTTAQEMLHRRTSWSGCSSDIRKHTKEARANFRHSSVALCLSKSQRGWSTAEHTKGRGQTSLTTTKIQGGCTTIYNLPSLLRDSRGGWREGEREQRGREADTQTEGGL